ncbi:MULTISPECIES: AzlC family ABC transporter permease [unclassified Candidatus Paralachnospira]|uniref:AzlC family ABC transporter permease n=1 Tax=unclassified Candidatus Paralachnospira TaxID=3099471 RepID=UPI003F901B10
MKQKAFRAAFPLTFPVFIGYIFLGIAFGILSGSSGFHVGWAFLMSLLIYAGSMQFVTVSLLLAPYHFLSTVLLTLMVNARHLFYGLSMLNRYKDCGKLKPYLIFSLTDETYSLVCSTEPPKDVSRKWFFFFISALNHFYWVLGSVIGALVGNFLPINTTGIDFSMTALFLVIFVDQWESTKNHIPALLGLSLTVLCRLIFGLNWFILLAMLSLLLSLSLGYKKEVKA